VRRIAGGLAFDSRYLVLGAARLGGVGQPLAGRGFSPFFPRVGSLTPTARAYRGHSYFLRHQSLHAKNPVLPKASGPSREAGLSDKTPSVPLGNGAAAGT
jgi:hypothetical protein